MWARAVLLVVLVLIEQVLAQSLPVVPYPRDYKSSLAKYAVVDRSDGMSRDLYASRDVIQALKRDPRLREFPVGVVFALDVYNLPRKQRLLVWHPGCCKLASWRLGPGTVQLFDWGVE